jgi:hypothetical protein
VWIKTVENVAVLPSAITQNMFYLLVITIYLFTSGALDGTRQDQIPSSFKMVL